MSRISSLSISFVLFYVAAGSGYAADRPAGYITLCTTSNTYCSLSNIRTNVAFGRNNHFIYKVLTGEFSCDPTTFGVSITGNEVYECSVPGGPASSSTYPSQPAQPSPANYGGPEGPASAASPT